MTDLAATHLAVCPYCKTVWELESIFPEQVKLMICWRCAEQYAGTDLLAAPTEPCSGQRPGFGRAARWMVGGAYALLATLGVALGYAAAHLWYEGARTVPVASGQVSTLPAGTGPAPAGAPDAVPFEPPSAGVPTSRPAVPGPGAPAGAMAAGEGSESVGSATAMPSAVPAATAPTTTVPAATVPATTAPATTVPETTVPEATVPAAQPSGVAEVPAGARGRGTGAHVPPGRAAALLWGPEGADAAREAGTVPGPEGTRAPARRPMLPAPTARGPSSPEAAAPTTAEAHGQDSPAAADARSGPACTQAAAALALCDPATTLKEREP